MGFIDSYKHLEKLCGEVLNDERRVSGYIDEMLNTSRGSYLVRGWDADLKQLKHYRWVRNQIVHEPGCSETNMCDHEDVLWLDNFYSRIMNQTDPLALYAKATSPRITAKTTQPHKTKTTQAYKTETTSYSRPQRSDNRSDCLIFILCAILCAMLIFGVAIMITQII